VIHGTQKYTLCALLFIYLKVEEGYHVVLDCI